MSRFSEISELRKAGELETAKEKAEEWLQEEAGNIWARRSMAWVLYDQIKLHILEGDFRRFQEALVVIADLLGQDEEHFYFEKLSFQIAKFVFQLAKRSPETTEDSYQVFLLIRELSYPKPSLSYSVILKAFHKALQGSGYYRDFVDWWGLENFQPEDYQKEEYQGRKLISLAEKVLIQYSKELLKTSGPDPFHQELDIQAINEFIPVLSGIHKFHPDLMYIPYYIAKLMIGSGHGEEASDLLIPFLKKKQNEFWAWQVLAETFPEDDHSQICCYCMAVICNTPEEFLVKIRTKLADLLIKRDLFQEAKFELEKAYNVRIDKGWPIPFQMIEWRSADWYQNAGQLKNNKGLYNKFAPLAQAFLYKEIPLYIGVINHVNYQKKVAGFVINRNITGIIRFNKMTWKPMEGQVVAIRLKKKLKSGIKRFEVLTAELSDLQPEEHILREFSGQVRKNTGWKFAIVHDIYIHPDMVRIHNIQGGNHVSGRAVLSYEKRKERWGWRAFEVVKAPLNNDESY